MAVNIAGHHRIHGDYMIEQPFGKSVCCVNTQMVDGFNIAISTPETVFPVHPLQYQSMLLTMRLPSRKFVLLHTLLFQFKVGNSVQ
jgi:hypothetical protein